MNAIIFSKDRAMQLHCLLESLYEYCDIFDEVVVIYKTKHTQSYNILKDSFKSVKWVMETNFKRDFLNNISDFTCLLVDDDIFFQKVDKNAVIEELGVSGIFSLRLGDNVKGKHFLVKSSVDGNIFRKSELSKMSLEEFSNPNELEIKLNKYCKNISMGYIKQHLIGVPHNRVSNTSGCDHMGGDGELLNVLYLTGHRIDRRKLNLSYNDVHKKVVFSYVKENETL